MRDVCAKIEKLGRSESPVLLLGETGTGKEVVARAIHREHGTGSFVPIDCSLMGTLLESELFGHARRLHRSGGGQTRTARDRRRGHRLLR